MRENVIKIKANKLMRQLTLEEKIGMIHGAGLFTTKGVERLGIPPLVMSDGPMGVRQEFEPDKWSSAGNGDDYVSYLPCNSALAATWNRKLSHAAGSVLGAETRGRGKDVILAPGINIKRSPLCGRNFEYFSEDPYLTGEMAVPFILGIQKWDVAACVKHFAANNQETQRLWVDVEIDERALREIYLPAFYDCLIKGKSLSVMGAYNKIYGEHCCQSNYLLHDILRKEWGYEGVVISDWGGVHDTKLAALSELDIEMSVTVNFDEYFMAEPLRKAVERGDIPEEIINEKVIRILMLMMKLHMLPADDGRERKSGSYNTPEHRRTLLKTARESIVLLKNEGNLLPLDSKKMRKILVIGENAERAHSNGGGSAEIKALYEITPLMGMKMLLGGNVKVDFVKGYESDWGSSDKGKTNDSECGKGEAETGGSGVQETEPGIGERDLEEAKADVSWQEKSLENGGGCRQEKKDGDENTAAKRNLLRRQAAEKAALGEYDSVIFVGGLNHDYDSEGLDRSDMKLPCEQDLLIQELLSVRPDMITVLIGGSPVEMRGWLKNARALIWSYYAGMEGGYALAETLFGQVNPSGKLPETFYKKLLDCSAHSIGEFAGEESVSYKEGIFVGYRYNETFGVEPEFCFGHGLSYTDFRYESAVYEDESSCVICRISNTGRRSGAEIVQVYRMSCRKYSELQEDFMKGDGNPAKELAGFEKIFLEPGETKEIRILVKGGRSRYSLGVGSSVKDIRLVIQG